jgi:uncharacterized protein (TIGR02284 family)
MINDYEATQPITTDAVYTPESTASNDDVISTLNGLIQTCKDGEDGFREAAEVVESSETKTFFAEKSRERSHFVGELQTLVRTLGGDPEKEGSVAAALHRGWMDLKAAIAGNDLHGVLVECERGEDSAKNTYREALSLTLPANVSDVVQAQYNSILATHDVVKTLRDAGKNASTAGTGF